MYNTKTEPYTNYELWVTNVLINFNNYITLMWDVGNRGTADMGGRDV